MSPPKKKQPKKQTSCTWCTELFVLLSIHFPSCAVSNPHFVLFLSVMASLLNSAHSEGDVLNMRLADSDAGASGRLRWRSEREEIWRQKRKQSHIQQKINIAVTSGYQCTAATAAAAAFTARFISTCFRLEIELMLKSHFMGELWKKLLTYPYCN